MSGLRVTIPVPLGKMDLPTSASITDDFPELCVRRYTKMNSKLTHEIPIAYLRTYDDDLWELDGVGADGVEHVLQLVDDGNEALHDDDLDPPRPVRKLLSSIPTTLRQDMDLPISSPW